MFDKFAGPICLTLSQRDNTTLLLAACTFLTFLIGLNALKFKLRKPKLHPEQKLKVIKFQAMSVTAAFLLGCIAWKTANSEYAVDPVTCVNEVTPSQFSAHMANVATAIAFITLSTILYFYIIGVRDLFSRKTSKK